MIEGTLKTPTLPWRVLRSPTPEDGAAAAVLTTAFTYNQKKASCIDIIELFGNEAQGIMIAMYGATYGVEATAENDAFGFDLIGYREPLDSSFTSINPALLICNATATNAICGTMEMSPDGGTTKSARWVDTIVLANTTKKWPGTIGVFDNAVNRIALLCADLCGCRYLYPWVHGALGANGGEAPSVGMIITAY